MSEVIKDIREYSGQVSGELPLSYSSKESGYQIETTEQVITLAISDEISCCEEWGYFLSEDDFDKFIGSDLLDISITDTNLTTRRFFKGYDDDDYHEFNFKDDGHIHLDEGDTMFVNVDTGNGRLQFAAYNAHNGYYGHSARVSSRQLTHEVTL